MYIGSILICSQGKRILINFTLSRLSQPQNYESSFPLVHERAALEATAPPNGSGLLTHACLVLLRINASSSLSFLFSPFRRIYLAADRSLDRSLAPPATMSSYVAVVGKPTAETCCIFGLTPQEVRYLQVRRSRSGEVLGKKIIRARKKHFSTK